MRGALLAVALAVPACTCIDASQPKRYLCTPDAGSADQCPGGWRCALEGFCVDPATGAALRCRAGEADCTGDWKCGFEGTCIDPAVAAPIRCANDDHCGGGWHCGPSGFCFDRRDAGAVPCRAGVSTDCDDGWRCGLDQKCHALDAGAPYLCKADSDCEARWRCGPDGECVDATTDGLRLNADAGAPFGALLNPSLPRALADHVSVNLDRALSKCTTEWKMSSASLVHGARFTKWVEFGTGYPLECTTDGGKPRVLHLDQQELVLPAPPVEVLDQGTFSLAVLSDGGLLEISYQPQAPLTVKALTPPFPVRHVKGHGSWPAAVFNAQAVATYDGTAFALAPNRLRDGGSIAVHDAVFNEGLFVGAEQGLLFSPYDAGHGPWAVAYSGCTKPEAVLHVQVFRNVPFEGLIVTQDHVLRQDIQVRPLTGDMNPQFACQEALEPGRFVHLEGAICTHRQGLRLPVFGVKEDGQAFDIYLHEALPDGGAAPTACFAFTTNLRGPLAQGARLSTTSGSVLAATDAHGALWVSRATRIIGFEALTLSSLPHKVGGPLEAAAAYVTRESAGAPNEIPIVTGTWRRNEAHGYRREGNSYELLGRVAGESRWVVMQHQLGGLSVQDDVTRGLVAYLASPTSSPPPPIHAAVSRTPGGRSTLVLANGDLLSHVDVTGVPVGGNISVLDPRTDAPQLRFATTPLPSGTITSLIALPGAGQPQTSYLLAYLVASGRVFRVRADNPVVFRSDELIIEPNEAISVWADGARGRVGFASGTIYGLPSRAKLADPIPSGSPVLQFESVCGHTFALTSDALYRLVAHEGGPIGAWQRVPLDSDDAGLPLMGALMYGDDRGLLIHRARGYVDELRGHVCLP